MVKGRTGLAPQFTVDDGLFQTDLAFSWDFLLQSVKLPLVGVVTR